MTVDEKKRHTVTLERETVQRLKEMGTLGDTYDILINRLIDHYHNFTIKGAKKR